MAIKMFLPVQSASSGGLDKKEKSKEKRGETNEEVQKTDSRTVYNQALDRAENYAGEQAVGIQEQFGALKMRADYCASEVRKATSQADAVERLRTVGTEQRSADG